MENIKIGVHFLLDVSIVNPHELENPKKKKLLSFRKTNKVLLDL